MANVYLHELKTYRKATILWSLGIGFLMVLSIAKYDGIRQSAGQINQLLASYPKEISALMGVNGIDITTPDGYFVVVVLYTAIMLGVHAVLLGSGIVAKEESEHTAEFLYTKPRSRGRILFQKLLAALTVIVILNLVTLGASLIGMDSVVSGSQLQHVNDVIFFMMPALLGIQLYFLVVGFAFASIMKKPKQAGSWAARVLLATFILYSFLNMTDKFAFLKYFTAFQYFSPEHIFIKNSYDPVYLTIAGVTVVALTIASFICFTRRDLDT